MPSKTSRVHVKYHAFSYFSEVMLANTHLKDFTKFILLEAMSQIMFEDNELKECISKISRLFVCPYIDGSVNSKYVKHGHEMSKS